MDEIDSRPHGDEAVLFSAQKMYQPVLPWIIFAVLTIAAAMFIMAQGRSTESAITNSGRNAQSASSLERPIQTRMPAVNSYEECAAAGYPIAESYPEQCLAADGTTYVRDISND